MDLRSNETPNVSSLGEDCPRSNMKITTYSFNRFGTLLTHPPHCMLRTRQVDQEPHDIGAQPRTGMDLNLIAC